jgi:Tetratricopeptide repeat/Cytochrome c554 and c-prime
MSDRASSDVATPWRVKRWPSLVAAAAIALAGLAAAWWLWWREKVSHSDPEPDTVAAADPRLTFPTPYRNVHPDVRYVGDRACTDCHRTQADSYRHHPMGLALAPTRDATPIEKYEPDAKNPFTLSGFQYAVVRKKDGHVAHWESRSGTDGQPLAELEADATFAMGSGARVRSYVISRDGYLFQSPITWFPHAGRWDLSPGYEFRNHHFARPITPGCLFCHSNYADHVPGTVNQYREPIFHGLVIGCERCHGPGELHVAKRSAGAVFEGPDDTIVNPARLEHSLREAVCQQCHVQGEQRVVGRGRGEFDYRPGLPLYPFLMDFVDRRQGNSDAKFVNSVEQMMDSRCYRESKEPKKLGCISCHDPHSVPGPHEKIAHYRGRCLQCHTDRSCSVPEAVRRQTSKEDSCIHCHMPRGATEVNHTSLTDHRIPRRPERATTDNPRRPTARPDDLVAFHRHLVPAGDEEESRNRGLAIMAMLDRNPPADAAREYATAALPLLERAVRRDRHDWPAVEGRANALWILGRREEAMSIYEAALAARPDSEVTLAAAGNLALELNRVDAARSYFERAVRRNPWRSNYYHGLAVAAFRNGQWEQAVRQCQQALRVEPTADGTRSLLIQAYLWDGRKRQAETEYEILRQLTPETRRKDLARWFQEEQQRAAR